MTQYYNNDKTESILQTYPVIGDFAVSLHHAPDEHTGEELGRWYRIQVLISFDLIREIIGFSGHISHIRIKILGTKID